MMIWKRISAAVVALTMIWAVSALAQSGAASPKATKASAAQGRVRTEMLISSDWLAKHLSDSGIVILHVGGEKVDFDAGHIPGARWLPGKDFIRNEPPGNELPTAEDLKKTFQALGVNEDARIILYANDSFTLAARAYFTLDYVGHGDHTALLDGGLEKWMLEKRALSTETSQVATGNFTPHVRPETLATREQVEKLMTDAFVVDARPLSRYRAGHIPGATSIFWEKNLVSDKDPVLLAPSELRKKLEGLGLNSNKKAVTYCETGQQSSFAYFVLKYLGYDVTNYDGSFNDWKTSKEPIVRGDGAK